ncbi:MAG: restriction endonuclease subunit S [Methylotenera sp.]|nr:restriction endonuclease subunit S [Methylotenera sp.]
MSEQNKFVPQLRFPEFIDTQEWQVRKFGNLDLDVSDGNYSSKYPSQSDFIKRGVPFLRANNLKFGTVIDEDMRFISSKQHSEITKGHLKKGDILLTTRGELGTVALVPERHIGSNINAQLVRVNTGNKLINTFLFQLLDYSRTLGHFEALSTGTALKQLPIGKLNQLNLSIPVTHAEQQKIADCLSSLDDLITAQNQKVEALKQHKKGLMQQLFPAEGETVPKLRFPEFENDGEWTLEEFSKYIVLYRGSSPRPIQSYLTNDRDGVNWIKIGDTKNAKNSVLSKVEERITPEGAKHSRKVNIGELILANSMSYGKTYQLAIEGCIYDGWFVLREYEKYFDKQFLLQLLNSEYMQNQYQRLSAGGIVQNISSDIVYKTVLPNTSINEQQKIANFLASLDDLITTQIQKLEAYKTLKKGLMQQLFPAIEDVDND